ncbi:MAG: DNA primase [Kaistella sp.]
MISQDTIERILSVTNVEEVVGDFVTLRKRGANLLGLCPFHNEKSPSFTVSPAKGIYKCFGCGKAGNSVNFIMEVEGFSYPEALKYLAQKYNIEIEETQSRPEEVQHKTDRESLYILLGAAQKHFTENLQTEEGKSVAVPYLKERKLNQKTVDEFALGWSLSARDGFSGWALKNGFTKEYLVRSGMSVETQDGNLIDRFRERAMFPIHNLSGKVVGFGGRILRNNAKEAKYINSPETEIYNKSRILYGLFQAKKAIRQHDLCIVVEGYMDVLSMYQAGVEHVVASSGTSLTEDQLRQIKRFTDNVILLFDGDAAGQKAALRGINIALEQGLNPRVVSLPAEHDPDTFAKAFDAEEIANYIKENAQDFVQFRASFIKEEERNDPFFQSKIAKEMLESVLLLPDTLKRAFYIKEIEKILGLSEKVLYEETKRLQVDKFKQENKPHEVNISVPPPESSQKQIEITQHNAVLAQEKQVIKTLLLYGDKPYDETQNICRYMVQELEGIEWEIKDCERIYNMFVEAICVEDELFSLAKVLNVEAPEDQNFISHLILNPHEISENWLRVIGRSIVTPDQNYLPEIKSAVSNFKLRKVQRMLAQNEKDIKNAKTDDEVNELLTVHMHLIDMKKQLAAEIGAVIIS